MLTNKRLRCIIGVIERVEVDIKMKLLGITTLALTFMMTLNVYASQIEMNIDQNGIANRTDGTIYVGDSRFNGMEMHVKKGEGYVVAKDSMGYTWLANEALPAIWSIKSSHPEINEWTIVSGLGVNDLYNINNYIQIYKNLSDCGFRVVALSVNPANSKRESLNNDIEAFNTILKSSELEYLDTYNHLKEIGFETVDGIHYNKNTCIEIWNEINWYLNYDIENEEFNWRCISLKE